MELLLQLLDPVLELLSMLRLNRKSRLARLGWLRHNWPLGSSMVRALSPVSEKAVEELGPLVLGVVDGVAGPAKGMLPQNLVIGALS